MDQRLLIRLYSEVQELRRAAQKLRDCIGKLSNRYRADRSQYFYMLLSGSERYTALFGGDENFENYYAAELRGIHLALLDLHDKAAYGVAIRNVLEAEWRKLDDFLTDCDNAVGRTTGITEYVAREARLGRMNSVAKWDECGEELDKALHLIDGALTRVEVIPAVNEHLLRESIDWLREQMAVETSPVAAEPEAVVEAIGDGPEAGLDDGPEDGAIGGPEAGAVGGVVDQSHGNGKAESPLAASVNGATVPKPLTGKKAKALEIVKAKPGRKAVAIANEIGVGVDGFLSRYVPRLREHGVYNHGDGYYWKPTGEAPPSAT